jgi:hypothetical protein
MSKTIANAPAEKKQVAWKKFLISGNAIESQLQLHLYRVEKREAIKQRAKERVFFVKRREAFFLTGVE